MFFIAIIITIFVFISQIIFIYAIFVSETKANKLSRSRYSTKKDGAPHFTIAHRGNIRPFISKNTRCGPFGIF